MSERKQEKVMVGEEEGWMMCRGLERGKETRAGRHKGEPEVTRECGKREGGPQSTL